MKAREYLDYRGRLRKMPRDERRKRIDYVIDRVHLTNFADRVIGHLSKGQRQRVGLADALLHNPPVLILDEPTVGLDPTQIIETRRLIKDLGGDHTVMLSTHILPEVEAVCDRAIIIAGGRIVAQGSPDELRASRRLQARVLVECKAAPDQVRKTLGNVAGVREVEILNGNGQAGHAGGSGGGGHRSDDGFVTAAVRPQESYDVREEVARTVLQNHWPLREIRLEQASLEEFFVQVTAAQAMKKANA
jgi:ABC-2 type transport system ATP-binding protein